MLRSLDHDGIAKVSDRFSAYKTQFLVMELCEGTTLAEHLDAVGTLDGRIVGQIVGQLAATLVYLREQRRVHGDLKPANVMLCDSGQVKLLDFGLSRALRPDREARELTESSPFSGIFGVAGTPRYMAPEQFGFGRTVDHRADWYALACIAYEALSGRPVAEADDLQTMDEEKRRFVLPPAEKLGFEADPEMYAFLSNGLQQRQEDRPRRVSRRWHDGRAPWIGSRRACDHDDGRCPSCGRRKLVDGDERLAISGAGVGEGPGPFQDVGLNEQPLVVVRQPRQDAVGAGQGCGVVAEIELDVEGKPFEREHRRVGRYRGVDSRNRTPLGVAGPDLEQRRGIRHDELRRQSSRSAQRSFVVGNRRREGTETAPGARPERVPAEAPGSAGEIRVRGREGGAWLIQLDQGLALEQQHVVSPGGEVEGDLEVLQRTVESEDRGVELSAVDIRLSVVGIRFDASRQLFDGMDRINMGLQPPARAEDGHEQTERDGGRKQRRTRAVSHVCRVSAVAVLAAGVPSRRVLSGSCGSCLATAAREVAKLSTWTQ